jgi:hypothetical protein
LPTEDRRSRLVNFNSLRLGEKFLVRVIWGALQRRVRFVGPNASSPHQVGRFQVA